MKKKRRRTIDPAKARKAAIGGLAFYPPEKCCGKCEQVTPDDVPDICGYCRATAPLPQTEPPDPF